MARRKFTIIFTLLGFAFVGVDGRVRAALPARRPRAGRAVERDARARVGGDLSEIAPRRRRRLPARRSNTPTVRAIVDNLRKAKVDARVSAVLLKPTRLRLAVLGQGAGDPRRGARLQEVGQAGLRLPRVRRRSRVLPGDARPTSLPDAVEPARPDRRRDLRAVSARHARQDRRATRPASHRRLQDGVEPVHREGLHARRTGRWTSRSTAISTSRSSAASPTGRKKTEADVRALIDDGPFLPGGRAARRPRRRCGVRGSGRRAARSRQERGAATPSACARSTATTTRASARSSLGLNSGPRIAVIYATGTINSGRSGYDPLNGAVGRLRHADRVHPPGPARQLGARHRLRIDSPGGSATASDAIWRELMLARNERADRPLVASMSDLAASGGYYIAMPAQVIVAQPSTLTGSIGIFGGKFVTGGVYEKLGAHIESTSIGKHAEINSPARPYNAERAEEAAGAAAGVLRPVRREGRRVAPQHAGEDRCARAGPRLDRPAGEAERPGRRARRAGRGRRHREGAREDRGRQRRGARRLSAAQELLRAR